MGQVDPAKEVPPGLAAVTEPEIRQAMRAEKEAARLKGSMLARFDFLVGAVAAAVGGLLCSGNHGLPCYSRLDAVRCSAM
jgi:hypothetical protein